MKILGITGGVGSGKSLALRHLEVKEGIVVYQADQVARELQGKGSPCLSEIVAYFGPEVLDEEENLNRKKLAEIVFSDEEKLEALNAMIHPAVYAEVERRIQEEKSAGTKLFVLEAAILFEANYENTCDETWFIYSNVNSRKMRLHESRNYSEETFLNISSKQMSDKEFYETCHYTIDNNGSKENLYRKLDRELIRLLGENDEVR